MKGLFCLCAALFLVFAADESRAASPTVSIVSPTNSASFLNDQALTITAQAQSQSGTVASVDFYDGATLLGSATPPTFALTLAAPVPAKAYELRAVATDNGALSSTSAPVRITVLDKVWSYAGVFPTGSPTMAQDGTIYVGSNDSVVALRTNGTVQWAFQTNAIVASTPAVGPDGTIYVAMGDRVLYALNTNGVAKWGFAAGGDMYSCAAIANDGTIYIGASDFKLYAIRTNGTKKWTYTTEFGAPTPAAIAGDGTVYFTADTKLYALNPTGTLKWAFAIPLGTGAISTPAAIGADGTIYFGTTGKQLRAISPSGTNRWTFTAAAAFNQASPIVGSDGVIYCSAGNVMYAVSGDGQKKWQYTAPSVINGPAALASDGSLYFCATERQFICLNAQGTLNWAFNTENRLGGAPLLSPDGQLCFSLADGLLMLDVGAGPDAGPWPMFHQNAQRRGQALSTPTITSFTPATRTNYVTGETIPLTVAGSSPNGQLARAEFYSDGILIGSVTGQPFAFDWTNAPTGIHQVSAKIIDVAGANVSSNPVRVDVAAPGTLPQILTQPVGGETTNTANITLTTDVFGSMPISYQWYKDGVAIVDATNSTFTLSNASLADSATYTATLSNAAGSVTTVPAMVSVLQPYRIKWSAEILDARGSPAIAQGTRILIPDRNGVAARGPGGQFLWQYRAPETVWSSPAIDLAGNIYFGVYNGDFTSITTDGDRNWTLTNSAWQGSAAIAGSGAIYSTVNTNLFSFSADGTTNWTFTLPYYGSFSPVIDTNETIFVGTDETYIAARTNYSAYFVAINPDGVEKWRREFIRGFANSAAVTADGSIVVGCLDTNVYALDPADGTTRWKLRVEGPVFGSPAIAEDNTIYIISDAPREGALTPAVLHAITPDGQVKWKFKAQGRIANSPAVAHDGTIYFGAADAYFYALNSNGTLKWKIPNYSQVASSPVIGFDGTIYYSTTGQFNAVEGASPLAHSAWPMFRHDVRHTGNAATPIADDTFYYPFSSNTFDDMVTVIKRDGDNLYVGGYFTIAGGVPANRIAKWDGHQWLALGDGLDAEVLSIAIDGTNVYAGGFFTHAGGVSANYIARWDGAQWHALGSGTDDRVYDLEVHDGLLYAAGGFAHAGGQAINAVATWNGSQWQPVGAGELYSGVIFDLLFDGSDLYGCAFRSLGTINEPISSVIKWNGAQWVSVGDIYGDCRTLGKFNGALYVGGTDLQSKGTNMGNLARWQNGAWKPVATIDFGNVAALAPSGDSMYVGGTFQVIAGTNINRIARFDGTNWFAVGKGVSGGLPRYACSVNAIDVHGSDLFVGGAFTSAGGKRNIYNFAHWDGTEWNSYGPLLRFVDGQFQLTLLDALGATYGIEASEDLVNWTRVATFNDRASATQYIDENAAKTSHKFYRAVTP